MLVFGDADFQRGACSGQRGDVKADAHDRAVCEGQTDWYVCIGVGDDQQADLKGLRSRIQRADGTLKLELFGVCFAFNPGCGHGAGNSASSGVDETVHLNDVADPQACKRQAVFKKCGGRNIDGLAEYDD